jgi:serine/threonine-protein kinase RsbW
MHTAGRRSGPVTSRSATATGTVATLVRSDQPADSGQPGLLIQEVAVPSSSCDPPPIPVSGPSSPRVPEPTKPAPSSARKRGQVPQPQPRSIGRDRPEAGCVQHFAATPTAASWARRHTADVLAQWNVTELKWSACQVVSELVSNAVSHAAADTGAAAFCRLTLKLSSAVLAVEVLDRFPDAAIRMREADETAESGRGLPIVTALCGRAPLVFVDPGRGKTVVALLPRLGETATGPGATWA